MTSCNLIKKLSFVWSALILCLCRDAKTTVPVIFLCVDCSIWLSVCFVYFAWVFVFCFMLFCAFWLRIYIFLFYFAFVFRSRARAAWEPLNGWPHTPTGGGLPLQCSLFPFFTFSLVVFLYFFLSSSRLIILSLKLKSSRRTTQWLTSYRSCTIHKITIQNSVNTIHYHCWLIMIFTFEISRFPPQNGFNHALVPHHCCESDLRSR